MATVSTNISANATYEAVRDLKRYMVFNPGKPQGVFLLTWSKTLTSTEKADFDGAGDFLELFTFPENCYLIGAAVVVPDLDSHATPTITLDLMSGSTVLTNDSTAGQAGGTISYITTGITDVSSQVLKLKIESAAATVPASYSAITAKALVYLGAGKSVSG